MGNAERISDQLRVMASIAEGLEINLLDSPSQTNQALLDAADLIDSYEALVRAVIAALPEDPKRHGGVFIGVTGEPVHKITMRVKAYEQLRAALDPVL